MRFALALFGLLYFINAGTAQSEKYCDTNYDFCLYYPNDFSMLASKGEATETKLFIAHDGQHKVTVAGYSNEENWSLEDIYYMNFEDHLALNADLEIIEEAFTDDQFEVLYKENEQLHFFRVQRQSDNYLKLSLTVPESQLVQLTDLRAQLSLQKHEP